MTALYLAFRAEGLRPAAAWIFACAEFNHQHQLGFNAALAAETIVLF